MKTNNAILASTTLGLLLSACGGGGGGAPAGPPADMAGTWQIRETITSTSCGDEDRQNSYALEITQDGASLTVTDPRGNRFTGTARGNQVQWTGSYPEDGGIVTITRLSVTVNGDDLSGNSTWTWSDGVDSCAGTSSFTGRRTAGGQDPPDDPGSIDGVYDVDEVVTHSSGCDAAGQEFRHEWQLTARQDGVEVFDLDSGLEAFAEQRDSGELEFSWEASDGPFGLEESFRLWIDPDGNPVTFSGSSVWVIYRLSDREAVCTGQSSYSGALRGGVSNLGHGGGMAGPNKLDSLR